MRVLNYLRLKPLMFYFAGNLVQGIKWRRWLVVAFLQLVRKMMNQNLVVQILLQITKRDYGCIRYLNSCIWRISVGLNWLFSMVMLGIVSKQLLESVISRLVRKIAFHPKNLLLYLRWLSSVSLVGHWKVSQRQSWRSRFLMLRARSLVDMISLHPLQKFYHGQQCVPWHWRKTSTWETLLHKMYKHLSESLPWVMFGYIYIFLCSPSQLPLPCPSFPCRGNFRIKLRGCIGDHAWAKYIDWTTSWFIFSYKRRKE